MRISITEDQLRFHRMENGWQLPPNASCRGTPPRRQELHLWNTNRIVWSVAFSPDGRWLVTTHGDGAILVWDVLQRERVANLREHGGGVRARRVLSPDGKRVATAGEDQSVNSVGHAAGR